ncbi:unnamed protein product [Rotaria sp. Silwood1]|nr:unnamed protein product [Rotaria sp. Silwood1]CAF1575193.1 unnamed protein product [Rotaria sp. Silwood1]CAF3598507.1 unnamed protein product [Rotaria sp. Silwood1]CAF3625711.1 unnamed protein product [Rotaria sp. Silwood1]CAF3690772.1 unnamed protein product [Rotaria sp. Silwood1]
MDTKGGLLSFNNFLSTSTKQQVAMVFVERAMHKNKDIVGVLFIMTIDSSKVTASTTPFALIDEYSAIKGEKEILFSMHTVFRVDDIKQAIDNSRLWEVQLALTDENDPQLAALTKSMREEINGTGWYRMGELMLKVGHFNQAEELYNELLKNASNDSDRADIYHQLGWLKDDQGQYKEAVSFYEKSLEIERKNLPETHFSLASIYINIGLAYNNMGDYLKALEFYEKALKIRENALSPNNPDLATSYNNIGGVYKNIGNYSKALEFHEKALEIREKSLPPNHPDLAASYGHIGLLSSKMGEHTKAVVYCERAFKIMENSLPPNHPHIQLYRNNLDYVKKM